MKFLKIEEGGMDEEGEGWNFLVGKNGVESWEETHSCFSRKSGFFLCKYTPYVIYG